MGVRGCVGYTEAVRPYVWPERTGLGQCAQPGKEDGATPSGCTGVEALWPFGALLGAGGAAGAEPARAGHRSPAHPSMKDKLCAEDRRAVEVRYAARLTCPPQPSCRAIHEASGVPRGRGLRAGSAGERTTEAMPARLNPTDLLTPGGAVAKASERFLAHRLGPMWTSPIGRGCERRRGQRYARRISGCFGATMSWSASSSRTMAQCAGKSSRASGSHTSWQMRPRGGAGEA